MSDFFRLLAIILLLCFLPSRGADSREPETLRLWPADVPGSPAKVKGEEADMTKSEDRLIAGRRIIKLGNVSEPEMHVYLPEPKDANGGAVVICPGGGFSILAWDLEGTEVAQWLNSLGYAGIVVKYRVPTRELGDPGKWQGPVMDTQRAIRLTRKYAADWRIEPQRIGVLGFSAGGETAARAATAKAERLYEAIDDAEQQSCAPNFAILVYPGGIADGQGDLKPDYRVDENTPPMLFVHAADDRISCLNSVALFMALQQAGVQAELHVFAAGGHGYGLRETELPVTRWSQLAADWLDQIGTSRSASPSPP